MVTLVGPKGHMVQFRGSEFENQRVCPWYMFTIDSRKLVSKIGVNKVNKQWMWVLEDFYRAQSTTGVRRLWVKACALARANARLAAWEIVCFFGVTRRLFGPTDHVLFFIL